MGHAAKLKAIHQAQKQARKGTARLQSIKIEGQIVAYDEHGQATSEGSGSIEPFFLMEAQIPAAMVAVIRKKFPKLEFVTTGPSGSEGENSA